MDYSDLELQILKHVQATNYQPVKPRVITRQLGLADERRVEVRKAVKRLARIGVIGYGSNHLVQAQATARQKRDNDVIGRFHRTEKGFGFVRPRGVKPAEERSRDIYIPARRTKDAATGDLVRVRLRKRRKTPEDDRIRGEVVEVLERETRQFVGTYNPQGEWPLVQVDGRVFPDPIPVGDPGAKNVQPNDKVVIEMVRFPSPFHEGEAVIVEVLGPRGTPGIDTLSIIREFQLPEEFAEEVLEDARLQADRFAAEPPVDRVDLTAKTIITIDPKDARDFDDAISLEQLDNGNWRLGVHIADVSYFVPPKSALDQSARDRATSVYLPDRVIPMLPEVISNHLASLQPHQPRLAKSVFLEMTPEGGRRHTEIQNTLIQSDHRFCYEEIDEYLADPEPWRSKLTPEVHQLVGQMYQLAMVLRQRRLDHGALELVLPEIKIDLDREGGVQGAHVVEHTDSHRIIEEFMLIANEAVAEWLTDQEVLFLRRIHADPSPKKLHDLTQFVRELGIQCESLQSRYEIRRVLEEVAGRPEEQAVSYAVLRSMQKAVYGPEEERHYALNKTHYCHFTSPIRRYPDLTVHRLIDVLASGVKPPNDMTSLVILGEHCSEREQRAESAERELIKVKLLNYLAQRLGETMEAVITRVENYGLFVQGTKLPADGLVAIGSLQDDYYQFDAPTHTLVGRRSGNQYRLGDLVQVEVFHVDLDRRQLDFRLVKRSDKKRPRASVASPRRAKPAVGKGRSQNKPKKGKRSAKRKRG
jgi:ribonuclease R